MDGSGGMLEAWPDNKPFMVTVPINTDNFIIYDEVAHNIGLVPNFLLRDKIIITYTLLKGLRNSYQFNNEYLEDMNRVGEQFALDKMNPEKIALVVSKEPVLIEIATKLKLSHNRVKQLVSELIVELKPYAEF